MAQYLNNNKTLRVEKPSKVKSKRSKKPTIQIIEILGSNSIHLNHSVL